MAIISNPVNSTVPIVAEVFKKAGVYDPKRLFGVTTLDVTRAATFLSGIANSNPETTKVPVIGGHSGVTIVPLLSQAPGSDAVSAGEQYDKLVHRIQFGGDEVVKAKDGAGSATLSMAYAAAVFTESLLKALNGEKGVKECTFVESPLFKDQAEFFASPVELGTEGVQNIPALPKLTAEEQKLLDACLPDLGKSTYFDSLTDRHQEGCQLGRREPVIGSIVNSYPNLRKCVLDQRRDRRVRKRLRVPALRGVLQHASILQHLERVLQHARRQRVRVRLERLGVGGRDTFGVGRRLAGPAHIRRPRGNVLGLVVVHALDKGVERAVRTRLGVGKGGNRLVELVQELFQERLVVFQCRVLTRRNRPRRPRRGKRADKPHLTSVLERLRGEPLPHEEACLMPASE